MNTRSKGTNLERINLEIERSCKKNRKEKREKDKQKMAENQAARNFPLQEYTMPNPGDTHNSIVRPTIDANNFEIKPGII